MKNTIAGSHSKVEKARCRKKERKKKKESKRNKKRRQGGRKSRKNFMLRNKTFCLRGKANDKVVKIPLIKISKIFYQRGDTV